MVAAFTSVEEPSILEEDSIREFLGWLAQRAREVAHGHADVANRVESLAARVLLDRRFRIGLRSLARQNRRAAGEHLELAIRAEKILHTQAPIDLEEVLAETSHPV